MVEMAVIVCAGGAVPFLYWKTVDTDVDVAPGMVTLANPVLGAQIPSVAFCVYHTVLGLGVYHSVLGAQLWTQKVELPDVYGMMLV